MPTATQKFDFQNRHGHTLSGLLDLPADEPKAFVLFTLCFTCNKSVPAANRIARGLRDREFAVLRFGFTGLGKSEGDFSHSNFSTNLDDIRPAIEALGERHELP